MRTEILQHFTDTLIPAATAEGHVQAYASLNVDDPDIDQGKHLLLADASEQEDTRAARENVHDKWASLVNEGEQIVGVKH